MAKHYHIWNFKFGIEVPKTWDDCVRLDKENSNTLRQDAVRKETKNARIAFKIINGDKAIPPMYQYTTCHIIFDMKMEDFWCYAHFGVEGHVTDNPHAMMYASFVPRESVCIALGLADLNDLDVMMVDIKNEYMMVPIT
jgi:hypothetical protein